MLKAFCVFTSLFFGLATAQVAQAQKSKQVSSTPVKSDVKFLDDITIESPATPAVADPKAIFAVPVAYTRRIPSLNDSISIETAGNLQFKYALLLDVEVEQLGNLAEFQVIDEWLGTQYRLGGTGKDGIDCSALMQIFYSRLYQQLLPRTAREQHAATRRLSRSELREGDLVFFNTIGGVSHVGMYLQNNKFVHASKSGVMISDLYDDYWMKRFIAGGRLDEIAPSTALLQP